MKFTYNITVDKVYVYSILTIMSKYDDKANDDILATTAEMDEMDECFELIDDPKTPSFIRLCRIAQESLVDNIRLDNLFNEKYYGEVMDCDIFAMECELMKVIISSPPIGGDYQGIKGKIRIPQTRISIHSDLYSPIMEMDEGNRIVVDAEIITWGDKYHTARCDYGMIYINKKKFAKYIPNVGNIVRMIVIVKEIEVAFRLACMVIL